MKRSVGMTSCMAPDWKRAESTLAAVPVAAGTVTAIGRAVAGAKTETESGTSETDP